MLLEHYDSTCIIVDENYQVRYTFGDVDRYLRIVPGRAISRNILELSREGLQVELTIALDEAFAKDEIVVRPGAWVRTDGEERIINITVKSIHDPTTDNRHKLIIFEPMLVGQNLQDKAEENAGTEDNTVVRRLRQELRQTQESLQRVTQALQAKAEELSSSMEEIRSANEEVQTTNEELRTSKEELESMNEELNTLNAQLTDQNKELVRANDTQLNFLQSTEIGVIFMDQKLAIREYTQAAANVFSLRKSDTGRPLAEITSRLMYDDDDLTTDMISVLDTLVNVEKEVTTTDGRWFDFKIRPYRTTENVIDGLVLTFNDVTAQKQAQHRAEQTTAYMRDLLNTIENPLLELDADLRVLTANQSFYDKFKVSPEQTIGHMLYELGDRQWDIPELRHLLQEIIPEQTVVRDFVVRHDFPQLGPRMMRLNARQVEALNRVLLVITDVSVDGAAAE
jgi:two-component system CheB/CheR fusion protein